MISTIIKIAGTVTANQTTESLANIDMPSDALIMAIHGSIDGSYSPTPAAASNVALRIRTELSFLSTNQFGTNDARGTIMNVNASAFVNFGEATETGGGGGNISANSGLTFPEGISVNAGERIHLHSFSSVADLTARAHYTLYLKTEGIGRRAQKRR